MGSSFDHNTTYFWEEGKPNLLDTLRISFEAAKRHDVQKIVIFTALGEGVHLAVEDFISQTEYAHIKLIAVTFPHCHLQDIDENEVQWILGKGIPLVRAHLPFDPIKAQYQGYGVLGQDSSLIGNVLSIFGGSMSLCIQAVLMACDAGAVQKGDHVIAMTSDTSILVRSAPTSHLLTDFIVREIFCKAVQLNITKNETLDSPTQMSLEIESSIEAKLIEG
jgi:hypothetical protein